MKYRVPLIVAALLSLLPAGCSKHAGQQALVGMGEPVPPPVHMDTAYTKAGLIRAVNDAAEAARVGLTKVRIDDSEFPFLVGFECAYQSGAEAVAAQIGQTQPYSYSGGVGTNGFWVMNVVPASAFPGDVSQQISNRLAAREAKFCDQISGNQ
jgi:hypothetical protein